MRKTTILATALAVLTLAGAADAQPRGGRGLPSATLFEGDNFTGRSVTLSTDVGNLSGYGFNDRAHSARLEGLWRLCEHADFGGRCVELTGPVDLGAMGLAERISSLQPVDRGGGRPGRDRDDDDDGYGGGWGGRPDPRDGRGVDGVRTVFFARPSVRGLDVAAGANGANSFCRRQGLGPAVWFDSGERAPRAIGPDGQVIGASTVIRDLLCRKP